MLVHSLGHSSFVLEMETSPGAEPVRVLFDPWLSDFCVGDLMGRFPRVRFEVEDLAPIHAIYLTHGHTDPLDPESLLRLWSGLDPRPPVLIPETIESLAPLLAEFLPGGGPTVLRAGKEHDLSGLEITLLPTMSERPTNEDDVLVLVARSETESFLNECDCLLPLDEIGRRQVLELVLGLGEDENRPPETACFLTTRNELFATMSVLEARSVENRSRRIGEALDDTGEEIHDIYAPLPEAGAPFGADPLWGSDRLVRLVGGQGLCHPQELDAGRNRTLFPIRIADRVRLEREIAKGHGGRHSVEELRAGTTHVLSGGRLVERREIEWLTLLDREEDRFFDPSLPIPEDFPDGPLRPGIRDEERQLSLIKAALDRRLLPLLESLAHTGLLSTLLGAGPHRIRILFAEGPPREFRLGFDTMRFTEVEPTDDPDEVYWANDLEDFLDGRCDEFSRYCRRPPGGRTQRLWRCLGLPFLNHDLVARKHRFHFERTARGETNRDWVLPFHG
jgi:hypothetical protein